MVHIVTDRPIGFTGRTRFRQQQRFLREPLLMLQIEERRESVLPERGKQMTCWRDVYTEDLSNFTLRMVSRNGGGDITAEVVIDLVRQTIDADRRSCRGRVT